MRQVARKGLLTVVAAGGALAATGGLAHADAGAAGTAADSPGVVAGNVIEVPVHLPVNLCGDTVNVIGVLDPALGNKCGNVSSGDSTAKSRSGAKTHGAGSVATGHTGGSPGVGSGNLVQAPVDIPANVCGLGVDAAALLNPTLGNKCANDEGAADTPATPETPSTPAGPATPDTPQTGTPSTNTVTETGTRTAALAETGAAGMGLTAALAGALMLGGAVLYRRGHASARR